jgi:hypothetical protein
MWQTGKTVIESLIKEANTCYFIIHKKIERKEKAILKNQNGLTIACHIKIFRLSKAGKRG